MIDLDLPNAIRAACLAAATAAYEDAGFQGLCPEGRWEAAVGAVQALDLQAVVRQVAEHGPSPAQTHGTARMSEFPPREGSH